MTQQRMLTMDELLYTREGREWLEKWCGLTPYQGDAADYLKLLRRARRRLPDAELPA